MTRSTNTVVPITAARPARLSDEQQKGIMAAIEYAQSESTRRNYTASWNRFVAWTIEEEFECLPADPEIAAAYMVERADEGVSRSTLAVARAAISHQHKEAGLPDPTATERFRKVLRGLTRRGARSSTGRQKQATGLTAEALAAIVATARLPRSGPTGRTERSQTAAKRGRIDIALCAVMRDAMLRRSEAAALTWSDVEFRNDGTARVTIRISKSDQHGEGAVAFIGMAAAVTLKAIQPKEAGPTDRVFPFTSHTISRRIAAAAKAAGLQGSFSGHSPRVGMAIDLIAAGASVAAVQVAGRWRSMRMPATYARGELAGRGAVARYYGGGGEE